MKFLFVFFITISTAFACINGSELQRAEQLLKENKKLILGIYQKKIAQCQPQSQECQRLVTELQVAQNELENIFLKVYPPEKNCSSANNKNCEQYIQLVKKLKEENDSPLQLAKALESARAQIKYPKECYTLKTMGSK